ncbi:hypothetical protein PIB30_097625, partial [Stylosanthes scabra]|nr:hypothetical protein [Stylosanthes scabra]
ENSQKRDVFFKFYSQMFIVASICRYKAPEYATSGKLIDRSREGNQLMTQSLGDESLVEWFYSQMFIVASICRYKAPEYATSGKLIDKSREGNQLMTQSLGDESLVEWARTTDKRCLRFPGIASEALPILLPRSDPLGTKSVAFDNWQR